MNTFAKQNKIKFWLYIEYAAKIENSVLPIDANINPYFLPIKLITLVAIIAPIAIPTTEIDIGKVASDLIGLI